MNIEPGRYLLGLVRSAALRLTLSHAARTGARVGAIAMAACVLLAVADVAVPIASIPLAYAIAAACAAVLITGVLSAVLRPVPRVDAARTLDGRLHLEERVSTAVEVLSGTGPRSSLAPRVIADAERALFSSGIADVTPLRVPRTLWWIPVLAAVLFAWTTWLHGITIPGTPAHRSQEVIRKEGERLEQFARTLESRTRAEHMPATRHLAPQIRDLGMRLQRERLYRAEALARVEELSHQLGQTRKEIAERLKAARPSPSREGVPPDQLRLQTAQQQIRQLRELLSRLQQDPSSISREAIEQLGRMGSGEGKQPAPAQDRLRQAREQLEQGNVVGANKAIMDALRELEGLESLLADSEGVRSAEQEMARSQARIAGGRAQGDLDAEREADQTSAAPLAPGQNRPSPDQGEETAIPQGPNEGTTAGTGRRAEKIGAPTPRLEVSKTPQRIRGAQGEGTVASTEVVGPGRRSRSSTASIAAISPTVVAKADQAMTRSRTPARYRDIVRRYFQRLAQLK